VLIAGCEFPDDLWYHVEHQVWARPEADGLVRVGITALGVRLAGDLYMCRPKSVGIVVEQGRAIAIVELAKTIASVKSPLGGRIVEVNPRLAAEPALVGRDPYGEGWLARVEPADWPADTAALLYGEAVGPAMAAHARLYRIGE
jgi:glycine cleavage system H protein